MTRQTNTVNEEDQCVGLSESVMSGSKEIGRLPDFLVVGAMKSGTTTLTHYLQQHNQVFMATPKEPQFFSRDENFQRGEVWYRALFSSASHDQLCGEGSTCYTRWPQIQAVPKRLAKLVPEAKFIYIMRHPVERCFSHYRHRMIERRIVTGKAPIGFNEALERDPEIIASSMYMRQIEQYLQYFGRDHFLFLTLDELKDNPLAVLEEVRFFLGLTSCNPNDCETTVANAFSEELIAKHVVKQQLRFWRRLPAISTLANTTPKTWRPRIRAFLEEMLSRSFVGKRINRRFTTSELDAETFERLQCVFEEPTKELEEFLGSNLTGWRR